MGTNFMFSAFIAWIFLRKGSDMLSRLVMSLMIVIAAGFLKDALFLGILSSLPDITVQLATSMDVVVVPIYAFILVELCNPGILTVKTICLSEAPFIFLPILLFVFKHPFFYYADIGLAILLGLATATWACFAIPRYHKYLKTSFSYDDFINLKWLQSILWAFFVILIVWALSCVDYNPWFDIVYMICTLVLWIFICFFIYKHQSVVNELRPITKPEATPSADIRREMFARIKKLIEEERIYLNPLLKLSDISQLANTNRSYASAYFSSEAGTTFYDHINQLRVNHAITLLADSSKRIDEVAELSGFNSRQSFHRIFLKFQGMTPNAYRATLQTVD